MLLKIVKSKYFESKPYVYVFCKMWYVTSESWTHYLLENSLFFYSFDIQVEEGSFSKKSGQTRASARSIWATPAMQI